LESMAPRYVDVLNLHRPPPKIMMSEPGPARHPVYIPRLLRPGQLGQQQVPWCGPRASRGPCGRSLASGGWRPQGPNKNQGKRNGNQWFSVRTKGREHGPSHRMHRHAGSWPKACEGTYNAIAVPLARPHHTAPGHEIRGGRGPIPFDLLAVTSGESPPSPARAYVVWHIPHRPDLHGILLAEEPGAFQRVESLLPRQAFAYSGAIFHRSWGGDGVELRQWQKDAGRLVKYDLPQCPTKRWVV